MPLLICPNCHVEMRSVHREQIEVDICTNCQGIWLDKGELEKLMDIAVKNDIYEKKYPSKKGKSHKFLMNFFEIFKE